MKTIIRKDRFSNHGSECGAWVCRSSLALGCCIVCVLLAALVVSCGGGGGTGAPPEIVSGAVFPDSNGKALVCMDLDLNGRCDDTDPQALADAAGGYRLAVAATSKSAPLIAEITVAPARADDPGASASFYRMASPERAYSSTITPFTTLVALSGQSNYALAEDLVRNALGLPPGLDISAVPFSGSFTQAAALAVTSALRALGPSIDLSAKGKVDQVIANLPQSFKTLPVLRISTQNAAPILSKETYVNATFTLTNPAVGPEAAALNGKIRGRGNSTWGQIKNPYKVQFADDAAYARVADFLGMKKNRNWALLADYFDRSLLRNKLAYSLGASSVFSDGLKWTPSGQHVEVYLNDDYIGVYLLTEDIRIDPVRLNIRKMSASASANDLDGGYLAEVDFRLDCYGGEDANLQLITPMSVPICIKSPDETAITPGQLAYIRNLLVETERQLYAKDAHAVNLVSVVDWYLLNELFRNPDAAFGSSVYLWKDSAGASNPQDRLLNMGPIWDFDRSAGNVNYGEQWKTEGCHVNHSGWYSESANWLIPLSGNSQFVDLVVARWKRKRAALATFINTGIDSYAARIDAAQQRNFSRWPWLAPNLVNYYPFTSHAEEVAFLKSFLNDRMAWLDQAYASPASFAELCKQP